MKSVVNDSYGLARLVRINSPSHVRALEKENNTFLFKVRKKKIQKNQANFSTCTHYLLKITPSILLEQQQVIMPVY